MTKLSLKEGSLVFYQGKKYKILKLVDYKNVICIDQQTNQNMVLPISELCLNPPENTDKDHYDLMIADVYWDEAKKRLEIIKPLLENPLRTELDVIEISKKFNVHRSTIYRWLSTYEANGLLSSLIPLYKKRGAPGKTRTQEAVELIVSKTIDELYLSKQKLTIRKVYQSILRKCKNARLEPPHENTIRNRINNISDKIVLSSRESKRIADRRYRNTDGMFPEGLYPLDVIQIDHTPMDIIIVDEKYRKPIGRPFITLAIDVYSRMVVGLYISLDDPSFFSVSQCLSNAILPKETYLRSLNVSGEWHVWGVPRSIHMDNANEFRGKELQRVCEQYGISIAWRPVARPQFGGHIERLVGTMMREIHSLPGTTFANVTQRGEYKSDDEASVTLLELEMYLVEFIVNVYHKRVHNGTNEIPEKRYERGIFGDENIPGRGLPDKIENEEMFRISLLPTIERTIQQVGVKVDKILYYSDSLRRWIRAKENGKARVFIFKRDPRDISTIWFFDPEIKEYFPIPYRNVTYPPISVWDLKLAQRYLDERNLPDISEDHIFKAYAKMQAIAEDAVNKTKSARRIQESKKIMKYRKKVETTNEISDNIVEAKDNSLDSLFENVTPFDEIEFIEKK